MESRVSTIHNSQHKLPREASFPAAIQEQMRAIGMFFLVLPHYPLPNGLGDLEFRDPGIFGRCIYTPSCWCSEPGRAPALLRNRYVSHRIHNRSSSRCTALVMRSGIRESCSSSHPSSCSCSSIEPEISPKSSGTDSATSLPVQVDMYVCMYVCSSKVS